MPDTDFVIKTRNLVKIYKQGNIKAVDGLNLSIRKSEIYAFIGANGSGKTTTIKMLTGILDPTSGSINVFGGKMGRVRAWDRNGHKHDDSRDCS